MDRNYYKADGSLLGEPPTMPSMQTRLEAAGPRPENSRVPPRGARQRGPRDTGISISPVRLQTVANAVAAAGLDPSVEIPKALMLEVPVTDRDGNPVLDLVTGEPVTKLALDVDTRLRTYLALLEYLQPKLRATDIKVSGAVDLSSEQLDARLDALLSKTKVKGRV